MGVSPVFDFVADCNDAQMQSHMPAYSSIMDVFDKPFAGTIIRVPLRTKHQARESEIVDCEVTVQDVKKVLAGFATEFGDCGMLFLRHIEQIEVQATSGFDVSISLQNSVAVRRYVFIANRGLGRIF
jgi:sacsin